MQTNRRRAELSFRIDTFVEKKNCLRCYRMHKKCDGGMPSCSRCSKAKAACLYTYSASENKPDAVDTSQIDLKNNVANLQRTLEQQQQAYRLLEEQLGQMKAQNLTLQNMNLYLSQALSAKAVKENNLASASEKQDLLDIYRNTGYYYLRVMPLFSDVYQYMQEKALGRNPLKAVTMELMFGATYLLLGKTDEGYHYMNAALTTMTANELNSPLGLVCMHMMAENLFIAGKKSDCTTWLQRILAIFTDMDSNLTNPSKARLINDQLTTLSQILDVNFAKSVCIMWTQWAPQTVTDNLRVNQYLKQIEVSKMLDDPIYRSINSPCCVPTFYILRAFSEIIVALEQIIDRPNDVPVVTEESITTHFHQLLDYSRMTSDPKMKRNFTRGVMVVKILVAVITANFVLFDQLMTEVTNAGYFDEDNPSPHEAMPMFILMQILYFLQAPTLPKAVQQLEKWSKSYASYTEVYKRWVDLVTGPLVYPVQLIELEDYFLVLPHLNYMRQHNITFDMYLPIFEEDYTQQPVVDIGESLLLTPFSSITSPISELSHESSEKSPSDNVEQSDSSLFGDVNYTFTPLDFTHHMLDKNGEQVGYVREFELAYRLMSGPNVQKAADEAVNTKVQARAAVHRLTVTREDSRVDSQPIQVKSLPQALLDQPDISEDFRAAIRAD